MSAAVNANRSRQASRGRSDSGIWSRPLARLLDGRLRRRLQKLEKRSPAIAKLPTKRPIFQPEADEGRARRRNQHGQRDPAASTTGSPVRRICSISSGSCPTPTASSSSCRAPHMRSSSATTAISSGARLPHHAAAPRSAITPVSALLLRHLEGEAEARQVLAGMVGRVSELRDQKVPGPLLLAAVDRRIKVHEMPPEIARRQQGDLDIALAVEGAGVADIAVVEDDGIDIRGFGPADALQMHGEGRTWRAVLDIERKRGGLDPKASRLRLSAVLDRERMRAAEVVGNGEMEFDMTRWVRHRLGDGSRCFVPATAPHAVADDRGPLERIALARCEAGPAYHHRLADTGEGRRHGERARRRQPAHALLRLLRYRRRQYRRTGGEVKAQREPRPGAFGALLHIAVGESKFAVQHLKQVHAGPSAGRNGECRRARRRDRRYPAREIVVVKEHPAAL